MDYYSDRNDFQYRFDPEKDVLKLFFIRTSPEQMVKTIPATEEDNPILFHLNNSNRDAVMEIQEVSKQLPCHFWNDPSELEGKK